MDSIEQWVDIDRVTAHLKVTKEAIRLWIKERRFPVYRAGSLRRFKLSEVDRWVGQDRGAEDKDNPAKEG